MENELGHCAQFSVYHLMQLKEGEERLRLNESSPGLFTHEVAMLHAPDPGHPAIRPAPVAGLEKTVGREEIAKHMIESPQKSRFDPKTLGDIARLIRSKNAGPYEVTLDVMFDSELEYQLVKESALLNTKAMEKLFAISKDDIIWEGFFDQALAYKVTIPRLRKGKPTASGGYMESDVHASQQYIGFMSMALPEEFVERWNRLQKEQDRTCSEA